MCTGPTVGSSPPTPCKLWYPLEHHLQQTLPPVVEGWHTSPVHTHTHTHTRVRPGAHTEMHMDHYRMRKHLNIMTLCVNAPSVHPARKGQDAYNICSNGLYTLGIRQHGSAAYVRRDIHYVYIRTCTHYCAVYMVQEVHKTPSTYSMVPQRIIPRPKNGSREGILQQVVDLLSEAVHFSPKRESSVAKQTKQIKKFCT